MNKKLKICVYAICKNESKFVKRWISALKEAECIVVLDTGSTDNTVELLEQYSPFVTVKQKIIDPWRFDVARNESMKLIPEDTDICVVSDLDQVFRPGWANILREEFSNGVTEVYGPIIDYDDNNKEIKRFLSKNVHPNDKRWYWERPIHEGVYFHPNEESTIQQEPILASTNDNFVIEHHPDTSKSRDGYLTLLENEYKTNSLDPMCAIYYGCELCFHNRNEEGMKVFLHAYNNCDFTGYDEVGYQICLNIADCYADYGQYDIAYKYAYDSLKYGIRTRRLYMTLSSYAHKLKKYDLAIKYIHNALFDVHVNIKSWIESDYWFKEGCYDNLALIYYEIGNYKEAYAYGIIAANINPENQRLQDNLIFYKKLFLEGMN